VVVQRRGAQIRGAPLAGADCRPEANVPIARDAPALLIRLPVTRTLLGFIGSQRPDGRRRHAGPGAVAARQNRVRPQGPVVISRMTSNPGDAAGEARMRVVRKNRSVHTELDASAWRGPRPSISSTTRMKVAASVSRCGNGAAIVRLAAADCQPQAIRRGLAPKAIGCRSAIRFAPRDCPRRQLGVAQGASSLPRRPTDGLLTAASARTSAGSRPATSRAARQASGTDCDQL
jgi:hypothetical protein